ncbi:Stk1 family PASTA domain-containing Ser/Thr kinase [Planctomonas sp. JC2975]|uniref:Stk1 family PASTA domain-containing Ser/Thr kinase n=1 Tax=Planctomonas sp. JC2975 TaxID=2729626 RepID=UPI001474A88E|nr:Stk1 family PASTA domain-containing Ser/Thr kinase [Planctomonas sp. JC2975]
MTASQPDPMLGRLVDGRYQVRSRIARGGMATVYLATDLRLERRVAIKVMHGHLADDAQFKNRFVQEARSAARLAHPNVVSVFDQGQDADMAYLVMEYLPGITLRDLLRDYGKLTPEQTIDITDAVLSGLAAAHRAGIVHRDLKPENVLLADDGRIKIGDFGLARAVTNSTGTGQALLGTIAYLSPELVTRGVADARSDIYALGIMMFEMLTGEQPFKGEQPMQIAYQHANDAVPAPSTLSPDIPEELDELVLWATAKDPADRPADAGVMLDRLLQAERELHVPDSESGTQQTLVLPGSGVTASDSDTQLIASAAQVRPEASATDAVAALATMTRRRRARGWWLLALVLVLAAVAGGTGWYFGGGPGSQVAIPTVNGLTLDAAKSALTTAGFTTKDDQVYSSSVPTGSVVSSDPAQGAKAPKGSAVTLHVSKGREPVTIPPLAGLSKAQAEKAITDVGAVVGTVDEQFNGDVAKGTVISAAKAEDDEADLSKGGGYFKGEKVNLVVSLGPVPDVTGKPEADAQAALQAVGLKSIEGKKEYSDDVPQGSVVSQAPQNQGPVRPGDTIVIDISRGPQLFPVPDVVGMTRDQAKKALTDAGFVPDYNGVWDSFPDSITKVTASDPSANAQEPKGTKVTLIISSAL